MFFSLIIHLVIIYPRHKFRFITTFLKTLFQVPINISDYFYHDSENY